METLILVMMTYLIVKHFVFDFTALQTPWMFRNKGTYGHLGGIAHSAIHAAASIPILTYVAVSTRYTPDGWYGVSGPLLIVGLALFEFLVHYHMDWFKMWWCRTKGYSEYITVATATPGEATQCDLIKPHLAVYSGRYFLWLGIDQLVHYLTYIIMVTVIWVS